MDNPNNIDCIGSEQPIPTKKRKINSEENNVVNKEELETSNASSDTNNNITSAAQYGMEGSDKIASACVDGAQLIPESLDGPSSPAASSSASESDWQPSTNGAIDWIHSQMVSGKDPREIIYKLIPSVVHIPTEIDNWSVWRILVRLLSEPPRRTKLSHINTFEDVIGLIKNSRKIMVLTGAGVSVSCGIPDFRSRDGIYARLAVDFPDLPNPEAMFDFDYFKHDPRPFFKFAKEIYPGQYKPSLIHRFIYSLEKNGKLLRNYTQNIDTLEQVAGISRVIQCHGSFATASCLKCKHQVTSDVIKEDIFNQVVPRCSSCKDEESIMKPDIVFFGENLPDRFHRQMTIDKDETDLLIVIGSALKVRPVALIPNSIPKEIPQVLINREPLSHMSFDVELLGDGDTIISEICNRLGDPFTDLCSNTTSLSEITQLPEETSKESVRSLSPTPKNDEDVEVKHASTDLAKEKTPNCSVDPTASCNGVELETGTVSRSNAMSSDSAEHCKTDSTIASCSDERLKPRNVEVDLTSVTQENTDSLQKSVKNSSFDATIDNTNETSQEQEKDFSGMWKSRWKQSISKRLPVGAYYYDGDHRYIFPGAEVAPEEQSDCSSDEDDSSGSSSDEEPVPVVGGLSPIRRHHFPHSLHRVSRSSETPNSVSNSVTSSDDDVTATYFRHSSVEKVGESSQQTQNDVSDVNCCTSPNT